MRSVIGIASAVLLLLACYSTALSAKPDIRGEKCCPGGHGILGDYGIFGEQLGCKWKMFAAADKLDIRRCLPLEGRPDRLKRPSIPWR